MKISELLEYLDSWAPFSSAKEFDNCGLLVGDPEAETKKVMLALDLTEEILDEAAEAGAGAVLTHHPLIFRAVKSFTSDALPWQAAKRGVAVIACHTNLDAAPGGVNDTFIRAIGLKKVGVVPDTDGCCALCACPEEISAPAALAGRVRTAAGLPFVRLIDGGRAVGTAAVCCGGGASFVEAAMAAGADALITGDIKYSQAVDAFRAGFTLIDAGHYETERLVLPVVKERLSERFRDCRFEIAQSCRPFFKYIGEK